MARGSKETRSAFCPVCGISHGQRRVSRQKGGTGYYLPSPTESFWDWLERVDKEHPPSRDAFGIAQEVGPGRGKAFRILRYYGPEEDQDGYYPAVKRRLLTALARWLQRGWLSRAELDAALVQAPTKRRTTPRKTA